MRYHNRCNYTSKLIEGFNSGFAELRLYPRCKNDAPRYSKSMKTLASQQRANERRSEYSCYLQAMENFGNGDYFVTITFSPNMSDDDRMHLQKKIIRHLQRMYKKHGSILKYIYNWGRGEDEEQLHSHMLINNAIPWDVLLACDNMFSGVNIHIDRIGSIYKYRSEEANIRHIIHYFYKHWSSLTNLDREVIQKHYYGSQSLNKYVVTEKQDDSIERPIDDSPSKLLNKIAKAKDFESVDKIIRRVFKGYRLWGFYYNNGESSIYKDLYGQTFSRLQLIRIGSKLDNETIKEGRMVIKRSTGEFLYMLSRRMLTTT